MKNKVWIKSTISVIVLALASFACQLAGSGQVATPPPGGSPLETAGAVATETPVTTESPQAPTQAALQPPTATPEAAAPVISAADLPVQLGSPLPGNVDPLNLENAGQLRLLGLWGLGDPQGLAWSPDGSQLAIGYGAGVFWFDANSGRELKRLRTAGWMAGFDISPDGQVLAMAHLDGALEFYDLSDGRLVNSLPDILGGKPASLRYHSGGEYVLVGLHQGMVLGIGAQPADFPDYAILGEDGYPVEELAASPDGRYLVGMSNSQGLAIWDLADIAEAQLLSYLPGTADMMGPISVKFSPDGRWLAASTWDGIMLLWEMSDGVAVSPPRLLWGQLEGFDTPGIWQSLAFSADSQTLAAGGSNGAVWRWEVATATELDAVQVGAAAISYLAYSPDGKTLAATLENGEAVLLQSDLLQVRRTLSTGQAWVGSLAALSGNGKFLATATQGSMGDGSMIRLLDADGLYSRSMGDGSVLAQMEMQRYDVAPGGFFGLGVSNDGRWLAASPIGLPLAVWEASGGALANFLEGQSQFLYVCNRLVFSPDEQILATGCGGSTVHLWQAASGKQLRSLQASDSDLLNALAFSPDGALLAGAGMESRVYLWNPLDGKLLQSLPVGDAAPITDLAFSADGKYLVCTAGRDYPKVSIWDVARAEEVGRLGFNDAASAVAFSPDGSMLAVALHFEFTDRLEIWDWQGQNLLVSQNYPADIQGLFITPDGRFVITASSDGLVRIWGIYGIN
jgi:WD40 repeat protein